MSDPNSNSQFDSLAPTGTTASLGAKGPVHVRYFGSTNVGLIREHNEDNFLVANLGTGRVGLPSGVEEADIGANGLVLAVCDGMGGAAAGEVASQMAVDTLYESMSGGLEPRDRDDFARRMVHAVEECGSRIFSEAKMDRTRRGMGTTATVAGLVDQVLFCAEVGDSRAYVLRNGELAQVTKDQSLVNQLIEAGQLTPEEAENFEHSNIILQALGTTEEVVVDLTFVELRQGDRVMLCSDGLSGLVHEESIRQTLASVHDLPACCARLIELANHGGGHDNITVIVADFSGDGLAAPTDGARPGYYQYPLPLADDETPAYGASQRELELKSEPPRPVGDVMDRRPPPLEEPAPEPEKKSINGVLIAASLALVFGVLGALWALSGDSVEEPQEPSGVRVLIPPRSVEEPPVVEEVRDLDELQAQEFVGEPEIVEPEEVTAPEEPEAVADDEQLVAEPIQIGEPDEIPVETLEVDAEDLEEAPTPVGVALPEMEQRSPRPLGGRTSSASNRGSSMGTMAGMRGGSSAGEMSPTPNTASMSAEASMTAPAASMALPDNPFL